MKLSSFKLSNCTNLLTYAVLAIVVSFVVIYGASITFKTCGIDKRSNVGTLTTSYLVPQWQRCPAK